jgi:hypothetical protein
MWKGTIERAVPQVLQLFTVHFSNDAASAAAAVRECRRNQFHDTLSAVYLEAGTANFVLVDSFLRVDGALAEIPERLQQLVLLLFLKNINRVRALMSKSPHRVLRAHLIKELSLHLHQIAPHLFNHLLSCL